MRAAKRDAKIAEAQILRPKRVRVPKAKPLSLRSVFADYLGLPGSVKPVDLRAARSAERTVKKIRRRRIKKHQEVCDQRFLAGRIAANKERDPKHIHPRHKRPKK